MIKWKDTKEFIPNIKKGTVIKVYDGDTITIATKIEGDDTLYRFPVRLTGIDTPEIKSKNPTTKEKALLSKNKLSELILNKEVTLQNIKREKFGRLLADVLYDGINISDWMLQNGGAVKYDGGSKVIPNEWIE